MTVVITLTYAGADTGPFDLYSNVDGFSSAFETGISKASLLAGYTSFVAPNGTTLVRVKSTNPLCPGFVDIIVTSATCSTFTFTGIGETGGSVVYIGCDSLIPTEIKLGVGASTVVCAKDSPAPYISDGDCTIIVGSPCTTTTTTTSV